MSTSLPPTVQTVLQRGVVLPAHPLALTAERKLDERRQRALSRYYIAAGAGGLAVGVHTTQFAIREPEHALYRPVLQLAAEECDRADAERTEPLVRVAGVIGPTRQAIAEAETARSLGYHAALLGLAALANATDDELIDHCRTVADVMPVFGFYLQPAVGGRLLSFTFWRRLAEIENVVAVKIAPFNRYQTLDVVRAIAESGRDDIALYTGNDDNIVMDLLTPYRFDLSGRRVTRRIVGGLLGHWAVWTRRAAETLDECHAAAASGRPIPVELLRRNVEVTDANAAVFDAANHYAGVICGVHEVLRRQGLLEGTWCLDPDERLSPGQAEQIDRVCRAYPHLTDDPFVAEHLDEWLSG
ncbi:MAG TPA: dihydrodipicolinate synthase family protein [Thermoguttaceae bacterium]|nr:dihydrodipicolinate synthase family protein [Thermoguttaceae bacterium]